MPITAQDKTGLAVKLYVNTGTTGSRVWLLLGEVNKSNLETSDEDIDTTSRADAGNKTHAKGSRDLTIPIENIYNGDDDGWDTIKEMGFDSPDTIREVALLPVAVADAGDGSDPKEDGEVLACRLFDYTETNEISGAFKQTGTFKLAKTGGAYPKKFSAL